MPQQSNPVAPSTSPFLSRLPFCGPPPRLKGENAADYDDLLARISGHLKPSDIIEEIWVREFVDLSWENLRWRRSLARLLDAALPKVLEEILQPLLHDQLSAAPRGKSFVSRIQAAYEEQSGHCDQVHNLMRRWAQRDPGAIKQVDDLLVSAQLSMDHVVAQVVVHELPNVERFNRLIASTEWRRNALLREIERRRADFGRKLRHEVDQIEDADIKAVEHQPPAPAELAH